MLSYKFTIVLQSKYVIAPLLALFRTSAHKIRQVRIPVAPVSQPSAVHFVSCNAVSEDEVRTWAGFRLCIMVATDSLELDVTFWNCKNKIKRNYTALYFILVNIELKTSEKNFHCHIPLFLTVRGNAFCLYRVLFKKLRTV